MSISFIKKGRTGNNLFQYIISRILADMYELNFENNFFSPVIDFTPIKTYDKSKYTKDIIINDTNIYQVLEDKNQFNNYNFIVEGYFQDSLFFNDNYNKILDYVYLPNYQKNLNDIVIHLRINDFNRDGSKSNVIHPEWYINILENETFEKLYIVIDTNGRKKYHYQDKEDNYLNYFNKWNPIIINNSEKEDFKFIMSFNKIISSNSTFSWWASYFSQAEFLYTPNIWRGKKKLSNIRNRSIVIDTYTCDIHSLKNLRFNTNELSQNILSYSITNKFIKRDQNCMIVLSNKKYFDKAINTIRDIRHIGKWTGDLVFVYGNDINLSDIQKLDEYCVIPKFFPDFDLSEIENKLKTKPYGELNRKLGKIFCFHKFHLFDPYFKNWNKVFYLDCGMRIYNPIQPLFDNKCGNNLLANSDSQPTFKWKLSGQFNPNTFPEVYNQLDSEFNLSVDYFQSTILLYNTKIIKDDTKQILIDLLFKYFNGITNDQAIMNLHFNCQLKIWKQVPLKKKDKYFYDYKVRRGKQSKDYVMTKI